MSTNVASNHSTFFLNGGLAERSASRHLQKNSNKTISQICKISDGNTVWMSKGVMQVCELKGYSTIFGNRLILQLSQS